MKFATFLRTAFLQNTSGGCFCIDQELQPALRIQENLGGFFVETSSAALDNLSNLL